MDIEDGSPDEALQLVFACSHAFEINRFVVLSFHLSETLLRGVPSHPYGEEEAMMGVWCADGSMVRGRAGVSRQIWRRMNEELEAAGLIVVTRRDGRPVAYTPQLPAIRAAIETIRNLPEPTPSQELAYRALIAEEEAEDN